MEEWGDSRLGGTVRSLTGVRYELTGVRVGETDGSNRRWEKSGGRGP